MIRPRTDSSGSAETSSSEDRVRQLTQPFGEEPALNNWAARMLAAADDFQKNKRPDPLGGFLVTHQR
jgi:hypothetical protein